MDEFGRCHVPAFGSWNNMNGTTDDGLGFSEWYQPASQKDLYPYYVDSDLYFPGDIYGYDVVTPAVIVVPRRRAKSRHPRVKETKRWDVKERQSPVSTLSPLFSPPVKKCYKPVDEDLYKISPDLLYVKPTKNKGWGIFSSCLTPCVA